MHLGITSVFAERSNQRFMSAIKMKLLVIWKPLNRTLFMKMLKKVVAEKLVAFSKDHRGKGLGTKVYHTILNQGFSIVSDEFHKIGGKALWKSIIRKALSWDAYVYLMRNGEVIRENGEPVLVTPEMDETKIWSTDVNTVLLFLTKHKL